MTEKHSKGTQLQTQLIIHYYNSDLCFVEVFLAGLEGHGQQCKIKHCK